jgi:Asp-tRNA(Asn)/Glu-tRNA(Gln) amidotransferase A subunit family amidase
LAGLRLGVIAEPAGDAVIRLDVSAVFGAAVAALRAASAHVEDVSLPGLDGFAEMHCSGLANLTGAPSVSIHPGTGEAGMPVGLTLNGPTSARWASRSSTGCR